MSMLRPDRALEREEGLPTYAMHNLFTSPSHPGNIETFPPENSLSSLLVCRLKLQVYSMEDEDRSLTCLRSNARESLPTWIQSHHLNALHTVGYNTRSYSRRLARDRGVSIFTSSVRFDIAKLFMTTIHRSSRRRCTVGETGRSEPTLHWSSW